MWTEIYLGKEVLETNDFGEKSKKYEYSNTSLFCNEKSVKSSEFYQAMRTGLKVEKVISLNKYEYYDFMQDAIKRCAKLVHPYTQHKIEYTIVREYEVDTDNIELSLVRGVENVNT